MAEGEGTPKGTDQVTVAEDCSEQQSSSSKALQINLIVNKVLSFLKVPDLKACSQVNHLWKKESRPLMAKRSGSVNFFNFTPYSSQMTQIQRMNQLVDQISTCDGVFPCSSFCVDTGMVKSAEDETTLERFFEAVAPFAKQIRICSSLNEGSYRETMAASAKYDKLERLEFELPWVHGGVKHSAATYPESTGFRHFAGIMEKAPNLKAIYLPGFYGLDAELHSVLNLLDCPAAQNIQQFEFRGLLQKPHLIQLASMSFNLRVIELTPRISCRPGFVEGLWTFLESQSSTLETLLLDGVYSSWLSDTEKITFPKLPKLRSLTICSGLSFQDYVDYQAVDYHIRLPNLTHLSLKQCDKDLDAFLNADLSRPFETLRHLELPPLKKTELSWIAKAASLFPKVRKLEMLARKDAFRAVCAHFGHVEHLTLIKNHIDCHSANIILTGLSEFLQNLRVLKLKDYSCYSEFNLTDRACQLVLLRLKSLECLDLTTSVASRISVSVLEQMRTKFVVLCEKRNIWKSEK